MQFFRRANDLLVSLNLLTPWLVSADRLATNTTSTSVQINWNDGTPKYYSGTTFGLPWKRGQFYSNTTKFRGSGDAVLESWVTGYWPDDSIKWTAHALAPSSDIPQSYVITAEGNPSGNWSGTLDNRQAQVNNIAQESDSEITVNTGKIKVAFPKSGSVLVSCIETASGKVVGRNGRLVLQSQNAIVDYEDDEPLLHPIEHYTFQGLINQTTVVKESTARALVTITGTHQISSGSRDPWLPFTVRFYLYRNSEAIRIVHSIVYDGNATTDFISGIGISFDVPLAGEELYNRHVRIAGTDGGLLSEAVQVITGLRRDPGAAVRAAQVAGKQLANSSTWDQRVTSRLQWIPAWNDFRLTQLSSDGFNLQKRTKQEQAWVKISGATRAEGLAYLGGATVGGLAVGLRDFWKKYPTSLDISNAATDTGRINLWLYSPSAPPLDVRPYHDGLGEDTYTKQLDALEITYEDYEPGYNTPYGTGRTSEIYVYGFDATPSQDTLSALINNTNLPPVLYADAKHIRETEALGTFWNLPNTTSAAANTIEDHLNFLTEFYRGQVDDRRWYGFFDYGDFMHTYDPDRHTWRYDIGGYAWDNSELSPDIFLWYQFLRTGDPKLYRFAEAQVRHGSEVDSYHLGPFKGLGTRHGVQHWADSAKQARISTPIYRCVFYWISGGDERTGEVIREIFDAEQAFITVDARRKVRDPDVIYVPDPEALYISLGIDWAGLASGFLLEWERRGPRWEEARDKILRGTADIPKLKNGFVTGEAYYNSSDGAISPGPTDPTNNGTVIISHLIGVFGMLETFTQIIDHLADETPAGFEEALLDYAYYYSATDEEQRARYGTAFPDTTLIQGHSRFSAYAALKSGNSSTAARAWKEFFSDGFTPNEPWNSTLISEPDILTPVHEAQWVSSNDMALYGVAAIGNLAWIGDDLESNAP